MTTAIILAGGLGTRLRSAVPDLPKPMAPVCGRPFLSHLMDYWVAQGVSRFILSIGYKGDVIQEYYGCDYHGVPVSYSIEESPLGTGGGVLQAFRQLQEEGDILLLNGDTFFAVDLGELRARHHHCQADVTMSLLKVDCNERYGGVHTDDAGHVVSLSASRTASGHGRINGGVYLMRTDVFVGYRDSGQACSLEDDLFPWLLDRGKLVVGMLSSGVFIDIGIPEDYRRASEVLRS